MRAFFAKQCKPVAILWLLSDARVVFKQNHNFKKKDRGEQNHMAKRNAPVVK